MSTDGTLTPVPPNPTVVVESKPWWTSITIWINIIGLIGAFLAGILELEFLKSIPMVETWIIGILGVINVLLRVFKTVAPVTIFGAVYGGGEAVRRYGGGPTLPIKDGK